MFKCNLLVSYNISRREWYGGPVGLGGCISNGSAVLAAKVMGADFAYIGSPFLATKEANTAPTVLKGGGVFEFGPSAAFEVSLSESAV